MRRIIVNRWWAFAFALLLGVAGVAVLPTVGRADGGGNLIGDGGSGSGGTDLTSVGDPDIPINTGRTSAKPSTTLYGHAGTLQVRRGAGDVTNLQLVWLYKYRVAMQVFRIFVLR